MILVSPSPYRVSVTISERHNGTRACLGGQSCLSIAIQKCIAAAAHQSGCARCAAYSASNHMWWQQSANQVHNVCAVVQMSKHSCSTPCKTSRSCNAYMDEVSKQPHNKPNLAVHNKYYLYSSARQLELQMSPFLQPLADVELKAALDFSHQRSARCEPHGG